MESWFKKEYEKLTQQILIIPIFHSCEFVYSLKFICNPKINIPNKFMVIYGVFTDMHRSCADRQNIRVSQHSSSQLRSNKMLCLLVSAILILQTSVFFAIHCHIFCIFVFLMLILLFKMTPMHSVGMLPIVSKLKKVVVCLTRKICYGRETSFTQELQGCWP